MLYKCVTIMGRAFYRSSLLLEEVGGGMETCGYIVVCCNSLKGVC